MTNRDKLMLIIKRVSSDKRHGFISYCLLLIACCLLLASTTDAQTKDAGAVMPGTEAKHGAAVVPGTPTSPSAFDAARAREAAQAAALVTEFEINGLKVLVKRREGSLTVAAGLFTRGGVRNVDAGNAGVEALMWDAATEGSVNFPREKLRQEVARMGTGIGSNADYDYSELRLSTTRANFDRSWEIFTDVALRPLFAPEDVERVRGRLIISRRDIEDSPDSYLQVLQSRAAYAGHPYLNDPEGTIETLGRLTVEDLKRYHRQVMQTSRLMLVVVGDLDANMLKGRIAETFGKLPRGDYRETSLPPLAFATASVDFTERALPTNYIQGVFAAPPLTSEDIYPMRVASSILNERVLVEVRFKRNLSYAPSAFLRDQGANIGGIYVTTTDANQAVSVMLYEIARLQRELPDRRDLTSEVSGYLTKYYMAQETNTAQVDELATYELLGGGWRNSLDFIARLRAVTPEDIRRVAQKYMRNIRFVVVGPNSSKVDKNIFTVRTSE